MTAPVYLPGDEFTVALVRASWQRAGTNRAILRTVKGQLWERVAERGRARELAAAFTERYGIPLDTPPAIRDAGPVPGESRAAWKERTFAAHYGAGLPRLAALVRAAR